MEISHYFESMVISFTYVCPLSAPLWLVVSGSEESWAHLCSLLSQKLPPAHGGLLPAAQEFIQGLPLLMEQCQIVRQRGGEVGDR